MQNIENFGASPTASSTTNANAVVQALVTGGAYVPAKPYLCDPIVTSAPLVIRGESWLSQILAPSIIINVGSDHNGAFAENVLFGGSLELSIQAGGCLRGWWINRCAFNPVATGYSLKMNNSINKADGIFTGSIERCTILSGIQGIALGDSIGIRNNVISGNGLGLFANFVSGANQFEVSGNNITSIGGGMSIEGALAALIARNNIEQPPTSYAGVYDAMLHLYQCTSCEVFGNTVIPMQGIVSNAAAYGILMETNAQGSANVGNLAWRNKVGQSRNSARIKDYLGTGNSITDNYNL